MEKTNSRDMGHELACFRSAIIAPVAQGPLPDASVAEYCRRATEDPIARLDSAAAHGAGKEADGNDND